MRTQKIFNELTKSKALNTNTRKGRNDRLQGLRNECLLARYFYYGYYKNRSYEDTLRTLVSEFFLSPNTITNIIQSNPEQLFAIKSRATVNCYFQNKWPHLKW